MSKVSGTIIPVVIILWVTLRTFNVEHSFVHHLPTRNPLSHVTAVSLPSVYLFFDDIFTALFSPTGYKSFLPLFKCTDGVNPTIATVVYRNVYVMTSTSFASAVILGIRLFNTSFLV